MIAATLFATSIVASTLSTISGVAFMVVWFIAWAAWGVMAFIANLMANDSGSVAPSKHLRLIVGMIVGQVIAAGAGIPGGLAFFASEDRGRLIVWAASLLGAGIVIQAFVFWSFFSGNAQK